MQFDTHTTYTQDLPGFSVHPLSKIFSELKSLYKSVYILYMKLLKAQHIHYPHLYKEYSVRQLENFYDYNTRSLTASQRYRLQCLMDNLDTYGLYYPIIISENGYRVFAGHQRVWYATQRGYSHISCYHCSTQEERDMVMASDYSEEYWKKSSPRKKLL